MSKTCPKHTQNIAKTCPKHHQHIAKTSPTHARNITNTCINRPRDPLRTIELEKSFRTMYQMICFMAWASSYNRILSGELFWQCPEHSNQFKFLSPLQILKLLSSIQNIVPSSTTNPSSLHQRA